MQRQELLRERDVPAEERHRILPVATARIHKNLIHIRTGYRQITPTRKGNERDLCLRIRAPHFADGWRAVDEIPDAGIMHHEDVQRLAFAVRTIPVFCEVRLERPHNLRRVNAVLRRIPLPEAEHHLLDCFDACCIPQGHVILSENLLAKSFFVSCNLYYYT